ncbi:uncharacterized protein LOC143278422 [Babylonia areolata]|uniref:uncharacterized protein LOC143278422 n=1 Tax=Babylonia areolata TaxID=304850 RepID=UPI003FD27223
MQAVTCSCVTWSAVHDRTQAREKNEEAGWKEKGLWEEGCVQLTRRELCSVDEPVVCGPGQSAAIPSWGCRPVPDHCLLVDYLQNKDLFFPVDYLQNKDFFFPVDYLQNKDFFFPVDYLQNKDFFFPVDYLQNKDFFFPVDYLQNKDFFFPVDYLQNKDFFFPVDYLQNKDFFFPVDYLQNKDFSFPVDYLQNKDFFFPVDYLQNKDFSSLTDFSFPVDYLQNKDFFLPVDYLQNKDFSFPVDYLQNKDFFLPVDYLQNKDFSFPVDYLQNKDFFFNEPYQPPVKAEGRDTESGRKREGEGDEGGRVVRGMEGAPWLLLLCWGSCLAGTEGQGELRCYCNEAGCVSTGYMCKSPAGRCYTLVELTGDSTRATHGCLDNVPLLHRGRCGRTSGKQQRHSQREKWECEEDMCNYMEDVHLSSIASLTRGSNHSTFTGGGTDVQRVSSSSDGDTGGEGGGEGDGEEGGVTFSHSGSGAGSSEARDLWFKAAVIAVPIAGSFILVLLVLLAVRMLRTDSQRHRRLVQVRRERGLRKAQLYVTDHFSDVSVKAGKAGKRQSRCPLVFPPAGKSSHTKRGGGRTEKGVGGERRGGGGQGGKGWCRDVNISVDREGRVYEKVEYDVNIDRQPPPHLPPATVSWGHTSDLATVL